MTLSAYELFRERFERDKGKPFERKDLKNRPVFAFLAHLRNAAAHNQKFRFRGEFIEGSWNKYVIKAEYEGMNVYSPMIDESEGFWGAVNLVDFLLDLENHYPFLKGSRN